MSNIISFRKTVLGKERLSMSNQGTDCFLDLLIIAADDFEKTGNQEKLVSFLKNRKEINNISPGTASFDIDEMPWSKDTLSEDVLFMTETIKKAMAADILRKLDYHPNLEIIIPWLDQFLQMIWKLDKSYLYGEEEREIVQGGVWPICKVLIGEDTDAKRRLLFYLDWYLDPYYGNDLSAIYEPVKEMLQDLVIKENEDDIKEEALYLLEAYMDAPYDIFEERINEIPPQFLSEVNDLIQSGEAERIELTGTLKQRIEEGEKHVRQADSGNYQK